MALLLMIFCNRKTSFYVSLFETLFDAFQTIETKKYLIKHFIHSCEIVIFVPFN